MDIVEFLISWLETWIPSTKFTKNILSRSHDIAEILLKVALSTINQQSTKDNNEFTKSHFENSVRKIQKSLGVFRNT